jgi:hypothetical protein
MITNKNEISLSVLVECVGCKRQKTLVGAAIPTGNDEPVCQFCYLPMTVKAASGKRIKRP